MDFVDRSMPLQPTIDLCGIILAGLRTSAGRGRALVQQDKEIETRSGACRFIRLKRRRNRWSISSRSEWARTVRTLTGNLASLRAGSAYSGLVHGRSTVEYWAAERGDFFSLEILAGCATTNRAGEGRALRAGRRARLPICLVMESTYGNRMHPKEDPLPELAR